MDITDMLVWHEGLKLKPYRCTAGKLTIGVGRNIEDVGITEDEARALLQNDIERVEGELKRFAFFAALSPPRRAALVDMCFNLGISRFSQFRAMLTALEAGDYQAAADEMLDSRWAQQVGARALRLSGMIRTGGWPQT